MLCNDDIRVQMELDKMAQEFRRTHAERHTIISQLEGLLELMKNRDDDIHDLAEVSHPQMEMGHLFRDP